MTPDTLDRWLKMLREIRSDLESAAQTEAMQSETHALDAAGTMGNLEDEIHRAWIAAVRDEADAAAIRKAKPEILAAARAAMRELAPDTWRND